MRQGFGGSWWLRLTPKWVCQAGTEQAPCCWERGCLIPTAREVGIQILKVRP